MNAEESVRSRYSEAAQAREDALCCPVDYDPRHLTVIPDRVIERGYGCGDPSQHLRHGETVLDLGSGGGKICFIASQVVGPEGRVIGVDMNDDMLALARGAAPGVAEAIGYANVEFRSVTVEAFKGKEGACWDHHEAVIYKGPFSRVRDDDGHIYARGQRTAVCRKTFEILTRAPYAEHLEEVVPRVAVSAEEARLFDCNTDASRDPRQTKGEDYDLTRGPEACC